MQTIYCRKAPTIGDLEGTPMSVWGTPEYEGDKDSPCVFFGLYGLPDFYKMWRHRGKKWILWAGSDIRHFIHGYFLDDAGEIRLSVSGLAKWIDKYCENWVENETERRELMKFGIEAKVCPSFLGNMNDFDVSYKQDSIPKLYSSVSGNDFKLYNWQELDNLAMKNPLVAFHLYGNTAEWKTPYRNIIVHGRVPKEQMNEEIKGMQGALRLVSMEGFSEIIAKSVLMGQYPVSSIKYPYMLSPDEIGTLKEKKEPNLEGRNYYIKILNKYPWNPKINL